jgi:hypothetical protein
MSEIIDMIDKSVRDYSVSGDAMRWAPEPPSVSPLRRTPDGRPDPRYDEALRQAICRWLERNGIDHKSVPADARCVILHRGCVVIEVYRRRDGKLYVDPATGEAARQVCRYKLRASPGPCVRAWLFADGSWGEAPSLAADGHAYRRRQLARRRHP